MNPGDIKVAVVYLIWVPYGIEHFKRFINSYHLHDAGYQHQLIFLFNGIPDNSELLPYFKYAEISQLRYKYYCLRNGQDIEAYLWISKKLVGYTHFLFLNSFSTILHHNWLQFYIKAIELPGVGLVGATGSWQSHYTTVFKKNKIAYEFGKSFLLNFRKYKLFVKASLYWRYLFAAFPSSHIRTTGFMIKSNLFSQLKKNRVNSKFDAYIFENGRNGMSSQLIKKGYQILVIDKFGKTFAPKDWPYSKTFWIESQQNLLIKDNQTEIYQHSNIQEQKKLSQLAWGEKIK